MIREVVGDLYMSSIYLCGKSRWESMTPRGFAGEGTGCPEPEEINPFDVHTVEIKDVTSGIKVQEREITRDYSTVAKVLFPVFGKMRIGQERERYVCDGHLLDGVAFRDYVTARFARFLRMIRETDADYIECDKEMVRELAGNPEECAKEWLNNLSKPGFLVRLDHIREAWPPLFCVIPYYCIRKAWIRGYCERECRDTFPSLERTEEGDMNLIPGGRKTAKEELDI